MLLVSRRNFQGQSLLQFGQLTIFLEDYVEVGYWSTIEVSVGVVCVCMPAVRALFSRGLPGVFGTAQRDTSGYDYKSSGSRGASNRPKYGNMSSSATEDRAQQHWDDDRPGNHSDVELVPVETMRTESPETITPVVKQPDQWSAVSTIGLPRQGRPAPSPKMPDQWSNESCESDESKPRLPIQGTKGSL
jgi:hypothetical protein